MRPSYQRVVLPSRNQKDVVDIPVEVKSELDIVYASDILEAMAFLFPESHSIEEQYQDYASEEPAWRTRVRLEDKKKQKRAVGEGGPQPQGRTGESTSEQPGTVATSAPIDCCGPILHSGL